MKKMDLFQVFKINLTTKSIQFVIALVDFSTILTMNGCGLRMLALVAAYQNSNLYIICVLQKAFVLLFNSTLRF